VRERRLRVGDVGSYRGEVAGVVEVLPAGRVRVTLPLLGEEKEIPEGELEAFWKAAPWAYEDHPPTS
jgi:hypothetical protein